MLQLRIRLVKELKTVKALITFLIENQKSQSLHSVFLNTKHQSSDVLSIAVMIMVELCGIEPQTSWMQTRRSPS